MTFRQIWTELRCISESQIGELVQLYLNGAERDELDPILDRCVANYLDELDEDGQVKFKGNCKAFCANVRGSSQRSFRTRILLGRSCRSFSIFLISKLPSPVEEDLSRGILDAIDMDSYRVEKRAVQKVLLPDEDAEIAPVPTASGGSRAEPEIDRLSNIIKAFNDHFGGIPWQDADRVRELITETIPARVAEDSAYKNARAHSDKQNAKIEHDKALVRVMTSIMNDDTELFKQFMDNDSFKRWMTDTVFDMTFQSGA